jgi:glycolate oxidase subunit GlcD
VRALDTLDMAYIGHARSDGELKHNTGMPVHPIIAEFIRLLGKDAVLYGAAERMTYESDAYTLERGAPMCTVLPSSTEHVAAVVKLCNEHSVSFAPRGAGTGKTGGTLLPGGVLIGLARMNRILSVDVRNRRMRAQAGITNIQLSKAVAAESLHYAPDPSSQGVSTLGGNIANNAGGPHTLKHGVTVNHVLQAAVVLPDGAVLEIGGNCEDPAGYDLLGLFCGAEGTLGIVTEATVRLIPLPESIRTLLAVFPTTADATHCVGGIMNAGITPAALELMDSVILKVVEDAFHFGFPVDAGAVLIIEIDGIDHGLDEQADTIRTICEANHASEVRSAADAHQRAALWASRKKAVGTLGRIKPSVVTQDGVIPRSKLPEVLDAIGEIALRYDLCIANVFHAGDGNLHPVICYDERDRDEVRRVIAANREILELCISVGGSISGEHGIGVEKRDFMPVLFPAETLAVMRGIREVFNPRGLCNADKILPTSHGCSYEIVLGRGAVAV